MSCLLLLKAVFKAKVLQSKSILSKRIKTVRKFKTAVQSWNNTRLLPQTLCFITDLWTSIPKRFYCRLAWARFPFNECSYHWRCVSLKIIIRVCSKFSINLLLVKKKCWLHANFDSPKMKMIFSAHIFLWYLATLFFEKPCINSSTTIDNSSGCLCFLWYTVGGDIMHLLKEYWIPGSKHRRRSRNNWSDM